MSRRPVSLVLLAFLPLLTSAGPVAAQEQSGSIQGTVRDSGGLILRGATVEARVVSGAGRTVAVTDASGVYRFPALPPGTYTVTARFEGFTPAAVNDVLLALGQLLTIDLTLAVRPAAESVVITSESPQIDIRQSASFATLHSDILQRLFTGADFTATVQIAPGARAETKAGGVQIDGASGAEHRWIIDGMDTTALRSGLPGKPLLADFVEEVQVKSSGYAAEFGGAVGGVVTARTKSGTNELHGSGGFFEENNRFMGPARPAHGYNGWTDQPESNLLAYRVPWQMWNPVGEAGGPVVRDRLWFYTASSYSSNTYSEDTTFVADSTLSPRRITQTNPAYMINYNATADISRKMRLRATGSNQRNRTRGTLPAVMPRGTTYYGTDTRLAGKDMYGYTTGAFDANADGTINQAAYDRRWILSGSDSQNDMYSANLDWVVTPKVFLNVTGGYYRTNTWTPPEARGNSIVRGIATSMTDAWMTSRGYPTVPAQYQQNRGFTDNIANSGTLKDMFDRADFGANSTWFGRLAGRHTVKAGMRLERIGNEVFSGYTKPRINFYWGSPYQHSDGRVLSGKYGYYLVAQPASAGTIHSNNLAFWVQDSWTIGTHLTINAGVRTENEHIPTYKQAPGAVDIRFGFADKTAPRLGFAYDVRGDGRWKTYGSFGYFYDLLKLEMARGYFGADHWVAYYWTLDTYDWSSISCGEGATGCPGTFLESLDMRISPNQPDPVLAAWFNRPGMTGIDPNLKPMKAGELTFGLDRELSSTMALSARYVRKWLVRTVEDVGIHVPGAGEVYLLGNPGFGYTEIMEPAWPTFTTPKAQRDYDAVEVRVRKRFSGGFGGEVNYTYSRLRGNYGGLASSDENGRVSPNVNRYFDAPYMSYDRNNRLVSGPLATDRPHVLNIVGGYDFRWGTSIGAVVVVESGLPQTSEFSYQNFPVYFDGRDDLGRTPVFSQVSLQVQHEFRLGTARRLALQVVVLNVLDQKTVIGYYSVTPYRDSVLMPNDNLFFGGPWTPEQLVALRRSQGAIIREDAWFKAPNTYQAPREVRFGVRFRF